MDMLLVVDGSNLLFQMFYGMPARILNARGRPIQGTLGFVGALLKMIRWTEPTHAAVLFDGEHENSRGQLDENYKANRIDYSLLPEEDTPFSQLPDVYAALDFLGIVHAETTQCETDDWIAGYAHACGEREMVIASMDSDYFQLITDRIRVLRYRGEKTVLCDRKSIREKLGIEPAQYADFKSLTGDPSDNIRGAEGIGPKTAAALLREFGSLENLLIHAEQIAKPSVRTSVLRNAQRLRRNHALICLENEVPLPFTAEQMAYRHSGVTTTEVLRGIGLK